ncbi:MAG: AAA family ATPase [Eubacteriaceae bacterium]
MNSIKCQKDMLHNVWNDADLFKAKFDIPEPAIRHLIYDGVTILGGAPKSGKSILVEQMAYAVATGTDLFGCQAQHGEVLYLNLESDPANALNRRKAMELPETGNINYYFDNNVDLGTIGTVAERGDTKSLKLIIVDTLQKIRGCNKPSDEYSYQEAVRDIDVLQRISQGINVPILVVHHTKKDSDSLLGSQGIFATVSSKLIVLREETAKTGQLSIVSRFHSSDVMDLKFNDSPLRWELDEEERGSVTLDPIVSAIMAFLVKQKDHYFKGTPTELWREASLASLCVNPQKLSSHLNKYEKELLENGIEKSKGYKRKERVMTLHWKKF